MTDDVRTLEVRKNTEDLAGNPGRRLGGKVDNQAGGVLRRAWVEAAGRHLFR